MGWSKINLGFVLDLKLGIVTLKRMLDGEWTRSSRNGIVAKSPSSFPFPLVTIAPAKPVQSNNARLNDGVFSGLSPDLRSLRVEMVLNVTYSTVHVKTRAIRFVYRKGLLKLKIKVVTRLLGCTPAVASEQHRSRHLSLLGFFVLFLQNSHRAHHINIRTCTLPGWQQARFFFPL